MYIVHVHVLLQQQTVISTPEGSTVGLKEREWGQMGVTTMQGTLGWTMLAPAAREYAVLPVGVEIMTPAKKVAQFEIFFTKYTMSHNLLEL